MPKPDPSPTARGFSFLLYSLVLFHLPAGRIVLDFGTWGDLKVGDSLENLLPLLLVARFLQRGIDFKASSKALKALHEPLFALLAGLLLSWVSNFSSASLQDLARLVGQGLCGFLLAEWIAQLWREGQPWFIGFILGMLWLGWRTPWGDLGIPSLEGPFGHRNTQSAFLLLAIPILAMAFAQRRHAYDALAILCALLMMAGLGFILVSRSRAGVVGVLAAAGFLTWFSLSRFDWNVRRRLAIAGLAGVFVLGACYFLAPRFRDLAQEIGNPYHQSRLAIWAAAVQEWRNPMAFIVGSGMGETFDRILIDSPTGNLNPVYRRTLHPHCLYLQWIVWGGVLASLGWFLILGRVWELARVFRTFGPSLCLAACLLGFAALELFESVFRFSRIAVVFFLNLSLLAFLADAYNRERSLEATLGDDS